ncbi:hypothetical protein TNCV_3861651 [Trichonephila clavipes]|nr:hypothetical protein TNCV_3861651 [Trichonephila clavipes]
MERERRKGKEALRKSKVDKNRPQDKVLQEAHASVRNRCLHLATGRTRDDIEKRIWQRRRRKARNERGKGDEEKLGS